MLDTCLSDKTNGWDCRNLPQLACYIYTTTHICCCSTTQSMLQKRMNITAWSERVKLLRSTRNCTAAEDAQPHIIKYKSVP